MKHKPWFDVLKAARRISDRGVSLTSVALAKEANIQANVASAWLFKFEKWNYVLRAGKESTGARWSWSWALTKWGWLYKASAKEKAHLKRVDGEKQRLRIAANPPSNQE